MQGCSHAGHKRPVSRQPHRRAASCEGATGSDGGGDGGKGSERGRDCPRVLGSGRRLALWLRLPGSRARGWRWETVACVDCPAGRRGRPHVCGWGLRPGQAPPPVTGPCSAGRLPLQHAGLRLDRRRLHRRGLEVHPARAEGVSLCHHTHLGPERLRRGGCGECRARRCGHRAPRPARTQTPLGPRLLGGAVAPAAGAAPGSRARPVRAPAGRGVDVPGLAVVGWVSGWWLQPFSRWSWGLTGLATQCPSGDRELP